MMKKQYALLLSILTVASCAKKQEVAVIDPETHNYETGVVIAESEFKGRHYANHTDGSVSDCKKGVGVGVVVRSTLEDSSFIFDKKQQPCTQAQVMFDGSLDKYSRTANPSIEITFNDKYGPLSKLNNIEKTAQLSTVLTESSLDYRVNREMATEQYKEMGLLDVEYKALRAQENNNAKQETFEAILKDSIQEQKAKALADARQIARDEMDRQEEVMVQNQDRIIINNMKTNKEKQLALAKLTEKTVKLSEVEQELHTLKLSKEVQANNYEEKMALLEKRVADYAQLSLMLKRENERLALTAQNANNAIENDLTQSERDAESARYAAMLTLAENIEVDEKLAAALVDSQQKSLYRKSQRLQTQADALAYHANADKVFNKDMEEVYQDLQNKMQPAFEGKIARVVGVGVNEEPSFKHVQLLLKETDKSANELLLEILSDVQPMLGAWELDWKLASHNLPIRDEKWNVTAETTFLEFFDYITNRVWEIHGVNIMVTYYYETRRIVITDQF